jgi:hypothetical protein
MSLLPYVKYTLVTGLSADEVRQRLSEQIEPVDNWRYMSFFGNSYGNEKPYEGYILDNKFKIRRISWLNYRYRTIVEGKIAELGNETSITISIWLTGLWLFFIFLILCVDTTMIMTLTSVILRSSKFQLGALFAIVFMNAMGIVVPIYVFHLESSKAQKFLSNLLEEKNDNE